MDLAPDPAIFVIDLQDANKKLFFPSFPVYYFLKVHLHNFSEIKSHKEVTQKVGIKVFLYYFCLMINRSGFVALTNGSGSRMLKKHSDPQH